MITNKKNTLDTSGARGIARQEHFASGGSIAEWRGKHVVHSSAKNYKRNPKHRTKREW